MGSRRTRKHPVPFGNWTFVIPVKNLILTKAVNREFRVNRVTFVNRDKLPYIRKRLGFGAPISELKKKVSNRHFFEESTTFAVVRQCGEGENLEHTCLRLVREEASILAASQLGYSKRGQTVPIAPTGEVWTSEVRYRVVSDEESVSGGYLFKATSSSGQVVLDGRIKGHLDRAFFTNLLKIMHGDIPVEESWRKELCRVALLVGESVASDDLLKSFLWNVSAIEMLLTKDEKGVIDILPRRAEALLGWVAFWEFDNYEDRIRDVYLQRNRLLHGGHREEITRQKLAFTDHLLVNLLSNLIGQSKPFRSKDEVIQYSKALEAERTLSLEPRRRVKRPLRFQRPVHPEFSTEEDHE